MSSRIYFEKDIPLNSLSTYNSTSKKLIGLITFNQNLIGSIEPILNDAPAAGRQRCSQALLQIEIGYLRSGKKLGNARHVGEIGQIFARTFP